MTDSISQLFLYLPGVILFLVGTSQAREFFSQLRPGSSAPAVVRRCDHVVKKDKKDREVYNYYNVSVEFVDPATGNKTLTTVKSPTEYALGQPVKVSTGTSVAIMEDHGLAIFHPVVMMVGGALLILLALFTNQVKLIPAMVCLTIVLVGAGASLLYNYVALKRQHLEVLNAEITDIYSRQISKETKILRGSKFTYYPIVHYELDGKNYVRRCQINSSDPKSFQVGETMKLYVNPETKAILEHPANLFLAIVGGAILIVGILAGLSILSAL